MMNGEGREEHGDEVRMKGLGVVEWGEEGFEFFDAHCHIDRVLRGVNVKGAEELGKRWEILGLVQGGGIYVTWVEWVWGSGEGLVGVV